MSRLAAAALAEEINRRAELAALDAELGPVPQDDLGAARQRADAVLPTDRTVPGEPVTLVLHAAVSARWLAAALLIPLPPRPVARPGPAVVLAEALTGDHRRDETRRDSIQNALVIGGPLITTVQQWFNVLTRLRVATVGADAAVCSRAARRLPA